MNKITKKLCGILCASVMMLTLGTAKAHESNYGILVVNNGNFVTSLDALHSKQSGLLGDVDDNGEINLQDCQYILRYSQGMTDDGISDAANVEVFKRLADVDGDGTITKADAEKLLRVYLRIETLDYSTVTWTTSTDNITSLKYLVINGDSELHDLLDNYYTSVESIATSGMSNTQAYNVLATKKQEVISAIVAEKDNYVTSPDNKTMEGSLGTTKVDNIYIATLANGVYDFYKFDVSNDNNWKFLSSKSSTNTNTNSGSGSSTKVSNNTTIDNSKTTGTDGSKTTTTTTTTTTTEETVENPKTAVTLTITGLVIAAVAGTIVAKKKNLFNRI